MAAIFAPKDCHVLMNLLCKEATGQNAEIQIVDTSSFVSVGETILATGTENTLNAVAMLLGRMLIAARPYKGKLDLIDAINTGVYTSRLLKTSFYTDGALAAGNYNTDLYTNLADEYDNGTNEGQSTKSMWVQNPPLPLQMNFGGRSVWQDSLTIYEYQIKQAFRNESEFGQFWGGVLTEKENDIELQKEAYRRMAIVSRIIAEIGAGKGVNMTPLFNQRYGTSYTSEQLRTTYLKDFLAFMVVEMKEVIEKLTYKSVLYHWSPDAPDGSDRVITRHSPKDKQKLVLYAPLIREAEAFVLPEIFHDDYLKPENGERVEYWQNINEPETVKGTAKLPNGMVENTTSVTVDNNPYIIGALFDTDALMLDFQLDDASTTPKEARKHYYNIWWSFARNVISDMTENFVVFYMADE